MKKIVAMILVLLLTVQASALAVQSYSKVYEPETSAVLPTTVAWKHDGTVMADEATPATAMVWLDESLSVYTEDGALICEKLSDYIKATTENVIPALYIEDSKTASALRSYLKKSELGDVFVVADYENADLVKQVANLLHVRGMVDFRSLTSLKGDMLDDVVSITNASSAKVALLSEHAADKDTVRYLQKRLITVWAECTSTIDSLLTAYTSGLNGVLVEDYAAAYDALSFFDDDAPTLLRVPMIIGHRGMPSEYVENTLPSALGAYAAGADSIEVDIYLSEDGELFVTHDGSMERLFNRKYITDVETLTLDELQDIPFSNTSANGVQLKNHTPASLSRYGSISWLPSLRIPSLEEIYETFHESGAVIDTEIKSKNPNIVSALKKLAGETGADSEMFVITFNTVILDQMAKNWPEISVGALGTEGSKTVGQPSYADFKTLIQSKGVEKALASLYGVIDKWNATFNPGKSFSYELAVAGRHRGLTVWPWTYNDPAEFADAYLKGLYGLTTNFAWWASDFVCDIHAKNVTVKPGASLPAPEVTTQAGKLTEVDGLELITVRGDLSQTGKSLCIYRLKQTLTIGDVSYGDYYLYSNPFAVTVKK